MADVENVHRGSTGTPHSASAPPHETEASLSRKIQTLKSALKCVSDGAAQLKEAGFDDLAADLRLSLSKIRREINHLEAVKDHPDLFKAGG